MMVLLLGLPIMMMINMCMAAVTTLMSVVFRFADLARRSSSSRVTTAVLCNTFTSSVYSSVIQSESE